MMPAGRTGAVPSPLVDGTHEADDLPIAVPASVIAQSPAGNADLAQPTANDDPPGAAPEWLGAFAKLIRPISVGALMAIPTVGPAVVGIVAFFSPSRAMAMVQASTDFLQALPTDVVALIAVLATGYGVARSFDKLKKTEP